MDAKEALDIANDIVAHFSIKVMHTHFDDAPKRAIALRDWIAAQQSTQNQGEREWQSNVQEEIDKNLENLDICYSCGGLNKLHCKCNEI